MAKILKIALLFGLIIIGIEFIKYIMFFKNNDDLLNLEEVLNSRIIIFTFVLPFVYLIITAIIMYFVVQKITSSGLGISLIKALIFAVIYVIVRVIMSYLVTLVSPLNFYFNTYRDFVDQIPNSIIQGMLFLFILNHFNLKNDNQLEKS